MGSPRPPPCPRRTTSVASLGPPTRPTATMRTGISGGGGGKPVYLVITEPRRRTGRGHRADVMAVTVDAASPPGGASPLVAPRPRLLPEGCFRGFPRAFSAVPQWPQTH